MRMKRGTTPKRRNLTLLVVLLLLLALAAAAAGWCHWVYLQIENYASHDYAAPADAICVFGAAEYDGHPSPVYRARLDHALTLYKQQIAPLIITSGGPGGDRYSEGAVGREYLMGMGVPEESIIAETESRNTEDSAHRIAVIARANGVRRLVIVSDGTHLFRIHEICTAQGLDVLTSPRPRVAVEGGSDQVDTLTHEILAYTFWRLDLH
jgi:uncharacterized SAM-binding protein YcdF (DUF218 family)